MSREPGFVANNHDCVLKKVKASCGTIMVDYASDFSFHFMQTSVDGAQMVEAKHKFERLANNRGVNIKHYYADNKNFNEIVFRKSCIATTQMHKFCGLNAYHQNGVADRKISTVMSLSRAMLFAAMIKNPKVFTLAFWPLAVHYDVDILNNMSSSSGFMSKEIFTGVKGDRYFKCFHTFCPPNLVLDPRTQQDDALPTWNPRSLTSALVGKPI